MALTGNQTAYLTARFGAARFGASRFGFSPKDTRGQTPGSSPKPYYFWARRYPAPVTWTVTKT